MSDALITAHRPKTFDDVVGQDAVIRSLKASLKKKGSTTFLFSGPSGTGKTTLARLVAAEVGCLPYDLIEIDGATKTGIDDMREVIATLAYRPVGEGAVKALIVDECHALSKQAWQALLKSTEDPPEHVRWLFCTTEPTRVPETVKTRCTHFALKPVSVSVLSGLLDKVAEAEKLPATIDDRMIDLCAKEASGSPRQALSNLAVCLGAKSLEEAHELLRSAAESSEAVELARALTQGHSWDQILKLLRGMTELNPESVRHVVRVYVTRVVLSAKSETVAGKGLEILDEFSKPFPSFDGITPLLLACGRLKLS